MYDVAQLQAMLQKAQAANDQGAILLIQQEIQKLQQNQQQAQAQQSQASKFSTDQIKTMIDRAKVAGDEQALAMLNSEMVNRNQQEASNAVDMREWGSTPGAIMADFGGALNKIIPNLKRLVTSEDSETYKQAQADIAEIERMQDKIRTAFPAATFGGEVGAPAAVAMPALAMGAPAAMGYGMAEAGSLTSSQSNPKYTAALAGAIPIAGAVGLRGLEKVAGIMGLSVENIISTLYRSADDEASRGIRKYLDDAGVDIDQALKEYESLGPNASLADTKALQGVGQYAAGTPAGRQFDAIYEQRQIGQRDRIMEFTEKLLGKEAGGLRDSMNQFIRKRADNAKPLYTEAFDSGFTTGQNPAVWEGLIDRTRGLGSFSRGRRLAKTDGYDFDPTNMGMKELHYIKLGLDADIEKAIRAGEGTTVRSLMGLKNEFLDEMDQINPAYAAARMQFAGDSAVINAMELGTQLFKPKDKGRLIELEDMQDLVSKFGADELGAFQQGAMNAISKKLAKVPGTADNARKLWNNPEIADSLKVAFNDPDQFGSFMQYLGKESAFTDTWNQLFRGSQTYPRQAAEKAFKTGAADVQGTSVIDMAKQLFAGKLSPEGEQSLAKMMFTQDMPIDELRQKMIESGILPQNVAIETVRRIRENWPEIYRKMTSLDPGKQFMASGAIAPGAVSSTQDYLSGDQQ